MTKNVVEMLNKCVENYGHSMHQYNERMFLLRFQKKDVEGGELATAGTRDEFVRITDLEIMQGKVKSIKPIMKDNGHNTKY